MISLLSVISSWRISPSFSSSFSITHFGIITCPPLKMVDELLRSDSLVTFGINPASMELYMVSLEREMDLYFLSFLNRVTILSGLRYSFIIRSAM